MQQVYNDYLESLRQSGVTNMFGAGVYLTNEFGLSRQDAKIVLWTHGHMHDPLDYMIGDTRVVCNPRGYVGEERRATEFKLKYLEI